MIDEKHTYYDILEVSPDATPQEIREAYLRMKSAYAKDSLALYTLMAPGETEQVLRKIEEAYGVLSSPERRRVYDRNHGLFTNEPATSEPSALQNPATVKIVSIDRVPPMESHFSGEHLLVAPTTEISKSAPQTATDVEPMNPETENLQERIKTEVEWRGAFLKEVREALRISIEEMSDFTKVSRTYLRAIEEEDFTKLPAPVFLRGFIVQIARKLKLPPEKAAAAYLARYRQHVSPQE